MSQPVERSRKVPRHRDKIADLRQAAERQLKLSTSYHAPLLDQRQAAAGEPFVNGEPQGRGLPRAGGVQSRLHVSHLLFRSRDLGEPIAEAGTFPSEPYERGSLSEGRPVSRQPALPAWAELSAEPRFRATVAQRTRAR